MKPGVYVAAWVRDLGAWSQSRSRSTFMIETRSVARGGYVPHTNSWCRYGKTVAYTSPFSYLSWSHGR